MSDEWIKCKTVAATPILLVAGLAIFYMLFQSLYIECYIRGSNFARCEPVNVAVVFPKLSEPVKQHGQL